MARIAGVEEDGTQVVMVESEEENMAPEKEDLIPTAEAHPMEEQGGEADVEENGGEDGEEAGEDDDGDSMRQIEMKRNSGDGAGYPIGTGTWDPNSEPRRRWDLLMMLLLLFCAFVTPFEIAFIDTEKLDALFWINQLINVLFIFDMILAFNTGYFSFELGMWITSRKKIVSKYMNSWFPIDVVSCFPFDIISLFAGNIGAISQYGQALRLVRLARLGKLLRIMRASRILNRWATRISISFGMQLLYKCLLLTVVLTHWSACAIRMSSKLSLDSCVETLLADDDFRQKNGIPLGKTLTPNDLILSNQYQDLVIDSCITFLTTDPHMGFHNYIEASMWNQYVVSLYWSVCALKGTTEAPQTNVEMWVGIWVMIIGGGVYTIMIGDVANVITNLDEAGNHYKKTMDNLNMYMAENHFDTDLQARLRSYFFHCKAMLRGTYHKDTLMKMSPILRGEVAWKENSGWVLQIPFFKLMPANEKEALVTEVSLALTAGVFTPQDFVVRQGGRNEFLYILDRGMCAMRNPGDAPKLMGMGSSFGADIIIHLVTTFNRPRKYSVVALTYVDVHQLHCDHLKRVLESGVFPVSLRRIRRAACKMLFRTFFADEVKYVMAKGLEDGDPVQSMEELIARLSSKLEKDRMMDPIIRAQMGMIDQIKVNVDELKEKSVEDALSLQRRINRLDEGHGSTLEAVLNKLAQMESKFAMQFRSLAEDVCELKARVSDGGGGMEGGGGGHRRGTSLSRAQLLRQSSSISRLGSEGDEESSVVSRLSRRSTPSLRTGGGAPPISPSRPVNIGGGDPRESAPDTNSPPASSPTPFIDDPTLFSSPISVPHRTAVPTHGSGAEGNGSKAQASVQDVKRELMNSLLKGGQAQGGSSNEGRGNQGDHRDGAMGGVGVPDGSSGGGAGTAPSRSPARRGRFSALKLN